MPREGYSYNAVGKVRMKRKCVSEVNQMTRLQERHQRNKPARTPPLETTLACPPESRRYFRCHESNEINNASSPYKRGNIAVSHSDIPAEHRCKQTLSTRRISDAVCSFDSLGRSERRRRRAAVLTRRIRGVTRTHNELDPQFNLGRKF